MSDTTDKSDTSDPIQLGDFMKRVLAVTPNYNDIARAIPGFGVANVGADVTDTMRKTASEFAQAYMNPRNDSEELQQLADELEGRLRAVATLDVAPEVQIQALVDDLHRLLVQREATS